MRRLVAVLAVVAVACACAPAQSNGTGDSSPAMSAADTVIGVVSEVGADPATWMAVRPLSGGGSLRLSGTGAATLRSVSGAEIWLSGAREGNSFRVDAFEVRRVNGQPVDDGVVRVAGSTVVVRLRSGVEREVPNAPQALREHAGARIWVTRPVAGQAPSFGVIRRPITPPDSPRR
jgi:hypothetical protein